MFSKILLGIMMIQIITPTQAQQWLASGEAVLIDVREADEFKQEHIAYALSLPLSTIEEEFSSLSIPQSRKIIFQCLKGARGEQACTIIGAQEGCRNDIYNIAGGIEAWKLENLPVISMGTAPKISIFRQVQIIVGGLVAFFIGLSFLGFTLGVFIAAALGAALCFAGITGWCGLALLLNKMPWNKG